MAEPPAPTIQLSASTQDALEGLGLEVTVPVPGSVLCAVCLGPAFGGVTTQCEHLFHKKCLEPALVEAKHCPTCRQDVGELKPMWRILAELMGDYKVRCPQGCGEAVEWCRLRAHVKDDCPHTPMICPHTGCEHGPLQRPQAVEHASVCEEAELKCTCSSLVKRKNMMAHHTTTCPDQQVSCEHCGQDGIKRGQLKKHWRKDCKGTATIPVVKSLLDRTKRAAAASQHQLRAKIRRLEQELDTACQTSFQLKLPKTISELDLKSPFKRDFGDKWYLEIRRFHGSQFVGVGVDIRPEARKWLVDAKLEVQIGSLKFVVRKVVGGPAVKFCFGLPKIQRLVSATDCQDEQVVQVRICEKSKTQCVDL